MFTFQAKICALSQDVFKIHTSWVKTNLHHLLSASNPIYDNMAQNLSAAEKSQCSLHTAHEDQNFGIHRLVFKNLNEKAPASADLRKSSSFSTYTHLANNFLRQTCTLVFKLMTLLCNYRYYYPVEDCSNGDLSTMDELKDVNDWFIFIECYFLVALFKSVFKTIPILPSWSKLNISYQCTCINFFYFCRSKSDF